MEDKPPLVRCELGNLKEKNLVQRDAHGSEFWTLLQHDEVASTSEERIELIENPKTTITIVESYEPSSIAGGKEKIKIPKEKCKSHQENCRKEEGGDFPQEPHSFPWPLKMDEKNIQKALHLLQDTHSSVAHQCWIVASLEDQSSLESKQEMQKALFTIQGEFLQLISNRDDLIELADMLHGASLKDGE